MKQPPHNDEAERRVLVFMAECKLNACAVNMLLDPKEIYRTAHRLLYERLIKKTPELPDLPEERRVITDDITSCIYEIKACAAKREAYAGALELDLLVRDHK